MTNSGSFAKKISRMFWGFSSDAWTNIQIISGVFTVLAGITAIVATIALNQLSKQQAAAVDVKVAGEEIKTQELEHKTAPRRIDRLKFLNILKGEPVGTVEIIYGEENPESYVLALDLMGALKQGGWTSSLKAIPTKDILTNYQTIAPQNMSMFVRSFTIPDDWVDANNLSLGRKDPIERPPKVTLLAAIFATIGGGAAYSDPSLQEGSIRFVIGPR
jgi:hypothetical protein